MGFITTSDDERVHTSAIQPPQRINAYDCPKCKAVLVTRDADEGVTPFSKLCLSCGASAYSRMYTRTEGLTPTHEWYKPKFPERYQHPGMRQHIEAGGLAFRPIGGIDETEYLPVRPPDFEESDEFNSIRPLTRAQRREIHRQEQKAFKKGNRRFY
jgi:predicted RNA-binding Zn-ribbon protein involved in translation (DUF1610 family)